MKRIFFAVDIHPDDTITTLMLDIRNHLTGEKIKWIPADQLHLTLKFLGDTPEDRIQSMISAVYAQLSEVPVMTLHLFSVGVFKNLHNPRIIWIGIKPCPSLYAAQQYLHDGMLPFGFPADDTEFLPHLTIGRIKEIKQREKLGNLIERYKNESFGTVYVAEILLYESVLKPGGPVYTPLMRIPLR